MKPPFQIAGKLLLLLAAAACSRHKAAAPAPPPAAPAATDAAATPEAPPEPQLPYELRLGKEVYGHYCSLCHGDGGAGDGFNAYNVDPHPRDLSDPAFQKAKTDADLRDAIRRGGAGVGLSAMMPPYGHTLTPDQIDQVVAYIRTFKPSQS